MLWLIRGDNPVENLILYFLGFFLIYLILSKVLVLILGLNVSVNMVNFFLKFDKK